tara:strand:+ start:3373 stop:4728 length:1356 start_codon:yes stop_codon:yes gene_type:complete
MSNYPNNVGEKILRELEKCEATYNNKKRLDSLDKVLKIIEEAELDYQRNVLALEPKKEMKKKVKKRRNPIYVNICNLFFEPISKKLVNIEAYGDSLEKYVLHSGIRLEASSYISLTLFTSFLLLFLGSALGVVLLYAVGIIWGIFLGLVLSLISLALFVFYPRQLSKRRKKKIDFEFPFIVTHMAAIVNTGVTTVNMFKILGKSHYYKYLSVEVNKVVSVEKEFGLAEALRQGAKVTPSRKLKKLFLEMGDNDQGVRAYLDRKSNILLTKYQLKRKSKYLNAYHDSTDTFHSLKFKWYYPFTVTLALLLLVIGFVSFRGSSAMFFSLLVIAVIVFWLPFLINIYRSFERRRKLEAEFFWFIRDLKRKGNLLKVNRDYKDLNPFVKQLMNDYSKGVTLEEALNVFASATKNNMIMGSVATVLEARKYGANLTEALDQVTTSKTMRNVLRYGG